MLPKLLATKYIEKMQWIEVEGIFFGTKAK